MKYTLLLIVSTFSWLSFSQENDSIKSKKIIIFGGLESNSQWYVNDVERKISHPIDPFRSNNYLLLNANYEQFTVGVQVESYLPNALLNYNPKFDRTDIGTYYANYKSKSGKIDATIGHFYEQFGSGLLLRSWEDRSLGINNALRGGHIVFRPNENIMLTSLYGRTRTGFDVANADIFGFNSDFDIINLLGKSNFDLSLGLSYVGRYEETKIDNPNFDELTNAYAGRVSFGKNNFYASAEYNFRSKDAIYVPALKDIDNNFVKTGNALLLNFGYSQKGLGIDATLRRLENFNALSERVPEVVGIEQTSLNYNDRIISFIPSLTSQHHSNLANIYVYQAQPQVSIDPNNGVAKSGEIGGQVDVFYTIKKETALGGKYGTKISFNTSNWFGLKADYQFVNGLGQYEPDYKTEFLAAGRKYFSDYNFKVSKKFSPKFNGDFAYINQYYNNRLITGAANVVVKTNIIFAEGTYKFAGTKAITVAADHMWADSDRLNWASLLVEYNHNLNWSVFAMDMYNYGFDKNFPEQISGGVDDFDIHFYNVGAAYTKGRSRIALNYGRQRGGLVCAGGVCRFVPPSTGLGISLSTSF